MPEAVRSHSRVEPTMSVKRKVTVPVGSPPEALPTRLTRYAARREERNDAGLRFAEDLETRCRFANRFVLLLGHLSNPSEALADLVAAVARDS
jgi:hypothetical protein